MASKRSSTSSSASKYTGASLQEPKLVLKNSEDKYLRQIEAPKEIEKNAAESDRMYSLRIVNTNLNGELTWSKIKNGAVKTNEQLHDVEY